MCSIFPLPRRRKRTCGRNLVKKIYKEGKKGKEQNKSKKEGNLRGKSGKRYIRKGKKEKEQNKRKKES